MTVSSVHTNKKPSWLKVKLPTHDNFFYVSRLLEGKNLNTICQSAKCPNVSECWSHKTATFLILGDTCTRACSFCSVKKGSPASLPQNEPEKTAEAIVAMGLSYAVITSVTRDDLPDGGASHFAKTLEASPDFLLAHMGLIGCYSVMGLKQELTEAVAEVLRIDPEFSLDRFAGAMPFMDQDVLQSMLTVLREVGLK